ncbi:development-specific protein LVN1.2 [Lytechinus pictus]|uniref:development-specific protein LVN1.2 n=1 Tax=Lytechinus pictus TaxID=7653 RepID=UPI0030BA0800
MIKSVVLVVLAVVVAVNAQKPICSPPQFMGGLGFTIGQTSADGRPEGFTLNEYGAWDFAERRLGLNLDIFYPNGTAYNFRVIQDYTTGTQFTIFERYRFCAKQKAPMPEPENCIPGNTSVAFRGFLGAGKDRLDYDLYTMKLSKEETGNLEGEGTFSVVRGTEYDIPLSNTFIGTYFDGETPYAQVSSGGYYNIEIGINDPKRWFDVPDYCPKELTDLTMLPKHIPKWTWVRLPAPRLF